MRKRSLNIANPAEQEIYKALEFLQQQFMKTVHVLENSAKDPSINPSKVREVKNLLLDMNLRLSRLPDFKVVNYGTDNKKLSPKKEKPDE